MTCAEAFRSSVEVPFYPIAFFMLAVQHRLADAMDLRDSASHSLLVSGGSPRFRRS